MNESINQSLKTLLSFLPPSIPSLFLLLHIYSQKTEKAPFLPYSYNQSIKQAASERLSQHPSVRPFIHQSISLLSISFRFLPSSLSTTTYINPFIHPPISKIVPSFFHDFVILKGRRKEQKKKKRKCYCDGGPDPISHGIET